MSSCWSRTEIKQINIYIDMAKKNLISQYKVSMQSIPNVVEQTVACKKFKSLTDIVRLNSLASFSQSLKYMLICLFAVLLINHFISGSAAQKHVRQTEMNRTIKNRTCHVTIHVSCVVFVYFRRWATVIAHALLSSCNVYEHVYSSKYRQPTDRQTDRYIQIKAAQTYR